MPLPLQRKPQFFEIVYLSIEYDDQRTIGICHRLSTTCNVNNTQSAMSEMYVLMVVVSKVVRAPVLQGLRHANHQIVIRYPFISANSAHIQKSPLLN
jgi:hypothetical protein